MLLAGCSSGPQRIEELPKKAADVNPPEPIKEVTGREAFQEMFVTARAWATDAKPFRLHNLYLKNSTGVGGKAAAWTSAFASPSLRKYRTYTYSTIEASNLRKGIYSRHDESYTSESQLTGPPFEIAGVKTDTDKVWEAAEKKGGTVYRKKNPEAPATFLLEHSKTLRRAAWRVCYDTSCTTSPFSVIVDAVTGEAVKVEK